MQCVSDDQSGMIEAWELAAASLSNNRLMV